MINKSFPLLFATVAIVLASCGGSGGGGSSDGGSSGGNNGSSSGTAITGQFKDSVVSGLSYETGGITGTTDALGFFECNQGDDITFSVGGVELGTASCGTLITPVDLVSGANTNTLAVANMVRFLHLLDEDGDATNGIEISDQVQLLAENWSPVDFGAADLSIEIAAIVVDLEGIVSGTLIAPEEAVTHLRETLLCAYSGIFTGTFSGDDEGVFGALVEPVPGYGDSGASIRGYNYSFTYQLSSITSGQTAADIVGDLSLRGSNLVTQASFAGQFDDLDSVSGDWTNPFANDSGTFSGTRLAGDAAATWRFSGLFSEGLVSIDVDESGDISGSAFTILDGTEDSISGTLTGASIAGTVGDAEFVGTVNLNAPPYIMSGTYSLNGSQTGAFSGYGCRLN